MQGAQKKNENTIQPHQRMAKVHPFIHNVQLTNPSETLDKSKKDLTGVFFIFDYLNVSLH